ncbi:hypothetical protein MXAN_1281 [Myxococcus xanthus DK 1622]|uniref:Uncharacterized protein n=2 Tax=Myxococcus TaxID=32 RepID=Q1DCT5_MYXXD|nr:hypothetical protein MXAN_1281 [Myxococcus xanthus DK 1622]
MSGNDHSGRRSQQRPGSHVRLAVHASRSQEPPAMFALPSPVLVVAAIVLFPVVLAGSMLLDAFETELEERPAQ